MQQLRIEYHTLKVSNAQASLDFYCQRLGMQVVDHTEGQGRHPDRYLLGYHEPQSSALELLCDRFETPIGYEHDKGDLFWKTGITLPDVDIARERLYFTGVDVGEPRQFGDVGYMCHLKDPDGFIVELLQHRFGASHEPIEVDPSLALGSPPTIGQVTIRTRNPAISIPFYRDLLGMKLLSRQVVEAERFTLYFLGFTDETPPSGDVDSVADREWLWQRPYTTIELQHVWGTENNPEFTYRTDQDGPLGFRGITVSAADRIDILRRARAFTFTVAVPSGGQPLLPDQPMILRDPDGTTVRVVEA